MSNLPKGKKPLISAAFVYLIPSLLGLLFVSATTCASGAGFLEAQLGKAQSIKVINMG
jgi:hypothetical protein